MLMPLPHLKSLQLDVVLLNGTPAPIGDSHYVSRFGVTANGSISSVPYHCLRPWDSQLSQSHDLYLEKVEQGWEDGNVDIVPSASHPRTHTQQVGAELGPQGRHTHPQDTYQDLPLPGSL